jgi:hypothetical protein
MAEKPRTPQAPRRVQAPRQRKDQPTADPRRKWLLLGAVAAAGVIALAIGAGVWALGGGSSSAADIRAAGCELETFPAQEASHVEELPEGFEYNSFPPSSGPHHPIAAPWGIYDEELDQIRVVHNLEHGGVTVQYGDKVPEEQVAELTAWYRSDPTGLVVAPLPELGDKVALAAWNSPEIQPGQTEVEGRGIVATCDGFDRAAVEKFMDEYAFQGPERFPPDSLRPAHG